MCPIQSEPLRYWQSICLLFWLPECFHHLSKYSCFICLGISRDFLMLFLFFDMLCSALVCSGVVLYWIFFVAPLTRFIVNLNHDVVYIFKSRKSGEKLKYMRRVRVPERQFTLASRNSKYLHLNTN